MDYIYCQSHCNWEWTKRATNNLNSNEFILKMFWSFLWELTLVFLFIRDEIETSNHKFLKMRQYETQNVASSLGESLDSLEKTSYVNSKYFKHKYQKFLIWFDHIPEIIKLYHKKAIYYWLSLIHHNCKILLSF